ncbi:MAG: hypothetical protein JW963_09005 [Anaerolineales bacterium]|nr:hypothetical protein [Anaerolineales bacterium]
MNATKAGEIRAVSRPGKVTLQAYNHERGQYLDIGSIQGNVYEKGNASILQLPEPSFTLSQSEYGAVCDLGAEFVRMVTREKITYSIELSRFDQFKQPYFNGWYGPQWRVSLSQFASTGNSKKRNRALDNPRKQSAGYHKPAQLDLFSGDRVSSLFTPEGDLMVRR